MPKLTDEKYFEKYGMTRAQAAENKKIYQREYNKRYAKKMKKGKKRGRKPGRKPGRKVVVRENAIPVTARLHSGVTLPMLFTTKDLLNLKQIEFEINELHAGAINKYMVDKINEMSERRNGHA